ncbi:hypothetical protein BP6252_00814 [Coleophoma cylindrospora]|uniref:Uncharacterized protein n=1 Tax=Coleophoma cylindrospora TaxID=1849047 RepID=A0A3D8SR57_9HELO|nr:hypothetical protein BP6252_00814 [Coleophoma cylindrospora]
MEPAIEPQPALRTTSSQTSDLTSSDLRFPKAATDFNVRTENWIKHASRTTMASRSEALADEGILGESAYDFIDTDTESRDDNATESVASTDFSRTYDVASLAGSDQSDEQSEDDENHAAASIPTYAGLDQSTDTPTIGRTSQIVLEELEKPLSQSIEFEEPFSLGAVSVKHTVEECTEAVTADICRTHSIPGSPKIISVTIRQTMAKQGLSTKDPLRILYIGSHAARQDILRKIGRAMHANVDSRPRTLQRTSSSQLFNVVPISAFGSEQTPEIELMHSSKYQMKIEHCIAAEAQPYESRPEKPPMIKLHIEDGLPYNSVPEGEKFKVEPPGELPQVAIFYRSDSDDLEARKTRTITRKFLSRYNIPSIVISHIQLIEKVEYMALDQHSIHMCLESRDHSGRGNIIHRRLPIDLERFLNIDDRQMNRNLAYLTSVQDSDDTAAVPKNLQKNDIPAVNAQDLEKTFSLTDSMHMLRQRNGAALRALWPVSLLLLSVFAAILTGIPSYRSVSGPAISINSKSMSVMPVSTTAVPVVESVSRITETPTPETSKTPTRTITVTQSKPSAPNSLSVVSSIDLGKIASSHPHSPKPANKTTVCGAEVLGDREILIRIPSATKLSWLSKEAMSVNVTRGNNTVDFERIYSSDEGLVLSLGKKEAYGIVNISIVTTRKPRINETFEVDFGTSAYQAMQSIWNRLSALIPNDQQIAEGTSTASQYYAQMQETFQHILGQNFKHSQSAQEHIEGAKTVASVSSARVTDFVKAISLEAAKQTAIMSKELGIRMSAAEAKASKKLKSLSHLREPLNDGLLGAQVQSKLLWLKMQGKHAEHDEYKQRAKLAIRQRGDSNKSRRAIAKQQRKAGRAAKKAANKIARAAKKMRT